MIVTIASSDNVTLAMFTDFYKTLYAPDLKALVLNCLYSPSIIENTLKEASDLSHKGRVVFITYKLKTQTKEISSYLIDISDLLIKFDIYSTEPEVLKTNDPATSTIIIDRWKKNIERFNKEKI